MCLYDIIVILSYRHTHTFSHFYLYRDFHRHFLALYPNPNPSTSNSNPDLNPVLLSSLKPSRNPLTAICGCVDPPKAPHSPKMPSVLCR